MKLKVESPRVAAALVAAGWVDVGAVQWHGNWVFDYHRLRPRAGRLLASPPGMTGAAGRRMASALMRAAV